MQCSVESRKPGEIDGKDSIKENTNSKGEKIKLLLKHFSGQYCKVKVGPHCAED